MSGKMEVIVPEKPADNSDAELRGILFHPRDKADISGWKSSDGRGDIYVYIHTHARMYTHIYLYTYTHTHMCAYMYISASLCANRRTEQSSFLIMSHTENSSWSIFVNNRNIRGFFSVILQPPPVTSLKDDSASSHSARALMTWVSANLLNWHPLSWILNRLVSLIFQ